MRSRFLLCVATTPVSQIEGFFRGIGFVRRMFLLKCWHCNFFHVSRSGSMWIFDGIFESKRLIEKVPNGSPALKPPRNFFETKNVGRNPGEPTRTNSQGPNAIYLGSTTPWPDTLATWRSFNLASFHLSVSHCWLLPQPLLQHQQNHAMRFALRFRENAFAERFSGFPLGSQQSWFTKNGPLGNDRVIIP